MAELIHFGKKYHAILILALGIIVFPFNKTVITDYPVFFSGKFNFFETNAFILGDIIITMGSLYLLACRRKTSLDLKILFPFALVLLGNPHFATATLLMLAAKSLKKDECKILWKAFLIAVGIQAATAVTQFITQSDIGLQILGEPEISHSIKGIAKAVIGNTQILRSYGFTPHSNILAAMVAYALINTDRLKYTLAPILLTTISLSAAIATLVSSLVSRKKAAIILTIILTTAIAGVKIADTQSTSLQERMTQTEMALDQQLSVKAILIGHRVTMTSEKMYPWEVQPIHNIYLLVFHKYGIIALALLMLMLFETYKLHKISGIFLSIIFLFDHFWITTSQGVILLTLIVIFAERNHIFLERSLKPS